MREQVPLAAEAELRRGRGSKPITLNELRCGLRYITWKEYFRLLTLTATAQLTLNWKSYQLSKPEIEFHVMEEMYAALRMCVCAEKTTFLGKDD